MSTDITKLAAQLHLAVSIKFHKKGWMYHLPPPGGEDPGSVALLTAYKMGLEYALAVYELGQSK